MILGGCSVKRFICCMHQSIVKWTAAIKCSKVYVWAGFDFWHSQIPNHLTSCLYFQLFSKACLDSCQAEKQVEECGCASGQFPSHSDICNLRNSTTGKDSRLNLIIQAARIIDNFFYTKFIAFFLFQRNV